MEDTENEISLVRSKENTIYLNCQGLNDIKSDLIYSAYVAGNSALSFICIAETWLTKSDDAVVHFNGFQKVTEFTRAEYTRGGVAIWCRVGLDVRRLNLAAKCTEKLFEVCGVKWQSNNRQTLMFLCYRSNKYMDFYHMYQKICEILEEHYDPRCDIVFMGDFNLDPSRDKRDYDVLCGLMSSFGLHNIVTTPTRGNHILDHVFINTDEVRSIVEDATMSDHRSVLFRVASPTIASESYSTIRRTYPPGSVPVFNSRLQGEEWLGLYGVEDLDEAFECFQRIFNFHYEQNFPLKEFHVTPEKHTWVTEEVKVSSNHLKNLFQLREIHPDMPEVYREAKKQHSLLVANSKKSFYQRKISKSGNTTRGAWGVVNDLTGKNSKHNSISLITDDSKRIDDPNIIVNHFNTFFQSAPHDIVKQIPLNVRTNVCEGDPCPHSLFLKPFVELELVNLVKNRVKPKKSSGYDGYPSFVVRDVIQAIASPLTYLVNLSFERGYFPKKLKISKIAPVYKNKGDPQQPDNYRPISLTSVFSKIFEYCFLARLEAFVKKFNLINPQQFGFRQKMSTQDAIEHFLQGIVERMEVGECPVGILCDLSRAFDCVCHTKLLNKLERYGIRGRPLSWVRTFLQDRIQYVTTDYIREGRKREYSSACVESNIGVPQGSVLAPILFILYVNDMVAAVNKDSLLTLYADDTSILISGKSDETVQSGCSSSLDNLLGWYSQNSLYLNLEKTKYLRFHNYQKQCDTLNLTINNIKLQATENSKFLGVHLDSNLSWDCHCSGLVSKLNSLGYLFRNLRGVLSTEQLTPLYYSYVESRLRYGIRFWGAGVAIKHVLTAQKRVLRCMLGLKARESCRGSFKALNILTVISLYVYELSAYIYNGQQKWLLNSDVHHYDTRHKQDLRPDSCRLEIKKRSQDVFGIKIFNRLPMDIKKSETLPLFRKRLKSFLVKYSFYTLQEFFAVVGGEY